ncbi:hypothetical protein O181_109659 [Austropuccinia psidii MF-1]|uniref:Uncharacterized protein n=1 Tax=Austropuccinia psidii MF-1 TaxID=1389203 RepID=A0A9Q3PQ39_9BASI|nr:hypothetical protein [Austropuccinia psidii MF-1]
MASSGHFDPSQTYDSYKAVEVLDPTCTECLAKGKDCFQNYNPQSSKCHYCFIGNKPCHHTRLQASNVRRYLWSRKYGPFGKELPVSEAPTPDGTSGFSNLTGSRLRDVGRWTNVGGIIPVGGRPIYSSSEVTISRINPDGVVKRIRRISDSPPDPDAEGSDELNGKEVGVVHHLIFHQSSTSSSQPLVNRFHSHIIPSTPRTFQPTLAANPTSPSPSHARPALNQVVKPSPITVTTMEIHLLGSPYGISSHSSFMANWPYPSPVANMATSSSYGPFMAICVLGPSWPFTSIQHP